MRKVKNAGVIRNLSAKSFRANRTRNLVAALAIALTAILFTALFTVGMGMIQSIEESNMRSAGGDAHGTFKNLTQEEYDILKEHPLIQEYGKESLVAYGVENPEFLKRHVEMHYVQEDWYPHWFFEIIDGTAPKTAQEILLDEKSMELLGMEPKAGQEVTLELRVHAMDQKTVKRTFTVSGVLKSSDSMNVGFGVVSEAYLEEYREEIVSKEGEEWDTVGSLGMEVFFSNSRNIQEKLNQIITESGFSTEESSDKFISSNANWGYLSESAEQDPMTLMGIAGALLLILFTGYLIIYNIFQISVLKDVRYYGLLKTIGATGRQIRRILRRQALLLCLLGTPAGLLLGYFVGKLMLPLIMKVGDYAEGSIHVSANPWIFAGAALFTVLTVLLSAWKPARIAGKVSPIEALRYTEQQKKTKREKKSRKGARVWRMAFSNLGRSKGRTVVVICSLSLTVILLNSVYTITHSIDREGVLSHMIVCEDLIANAAFWNFDYRPVTEELAQEAGLTESFVKACMEQESFQEGGRLYMTMNAGMPVDSWEIPEYVDRDEEGYPGKWYGGRFQRFYGYEEGAYQTNYYGMEEFVLSKMEIVEGETDKEKIWEKLQTGDYLVYTVETDDNGLVMEDEVWHHAGDKVRLNLGDGEQKEYEIISVAKQHNYSLQNRMSNIFSYYVSAEEFLEHYSEAYLMSFLMDTKEGQEHAMESFLEDYTTNTEPAMSYESRQTFQGMYDQLVGTITIVGTALSFVIGLIGVLNFVNTMLTSVVTRQREFAMMEAVGMTGKQLRKMLILEGMFYALWTIVFSLLVGSLFSLVVIKGISSGVWLISYRFTLLPMAVAVPVLLLIGFLVPFVIASRRKKESLVEQMRE
jgi:putative ABC transport system permease protein